MTEWFQVGDKVSEWGCFVALLCPLSEFILAVLWYTLLFLSLMECPSSYFKWLGFIVWPKWSLPMIARLMGPTWGSSGADRTQVGPTLAPWTLLSGYHLCHDWHHQEAVLSVWFFPNPSRSFQGFVPLKMRTNWSYWSTKVPSKPFFNKIHDHGSQTSKFLCGTS